ncbi:nitroreductase family protein [candidate division KSB1 bacterium]|nr:nitroreductase family protein [candidate division KSB1 bacterium]MBL7093014.1 nitroreductase family protein [candidate division KSB1 bacterium]
METILTRRSIRKYTEQPVSEDDVNDLLKAGMAAPSANNCQPWHFIVINDHQLMDKIPEFHPYSRMLRQASTAILVCIDKNLENADGYGIQDCSAATQNILLAAHAKGLGAVWLGIYPRQVRINGIKELLKIPGDIVPLSLISIGYPKEEKPPVNRFNEARIHYNRW